MVLQRAWNKYGEENFTFDFVEEVLGDKDVRLGREQTYLDEGFEQGVLYNIARDATASMSGKYHTEETKAKISEARKGKKFSEEHKANLSESHKGQIPWHKGKTGVYSKETIARLSKANMGKKHTEETKTKIGEALTGIKRTEETRAKMSKASEGNEKPAKSFPAFYNEKMTGFIPAGHNLMKMCRNCGLSSGNFSNLKLGVTKQSHDGWRLATESEIASRSMLP